MTEITFRFNLLLHIYASCEMHFCFFFVFACFGLFLHARKVATFDSNDFGIQTLDKYYIHSHLGMYLYMYIYIIYIFFVCIHSVEVIIYCWKPAWS